MRNTKCKRTKNIAKKCIELAQLCELDINLTIYDKKRNKIQEICTSNHITLKNIVELFQEQSAPRNQEINPSLDTSRVLKYKFRLAQDLLAGKIEKYVAVPVTPSFPRACLDLVSKTNSSGSSGQESLISPSASGHYLEREQVLGKRTEMQRRPSEYIQEIRQSSEQSKRVSQ